MKLGANVLGGLESFEYHVPAKKVRYEASGILSESLGGLSGASCVSWGLLGTPSWPVGRVL